MAIDPRISLAADAGSIGNIFSNALSTAQQAQTLRQNRELAPIQNQLLQAQAAQAESGVEQSQQLNRVRSLAIYGQNAAPFLQSGDLEGLREFTVNRSGELAAQGTPNNDTADVLAIIDNPTVSREQKIQGLSELSARAQQNAISLGALQAPSTVTGTASQRDFGTFQELLAKANQTGDPADIQAANQFGRQAGFTRETAQELADIKQQQAIGTAEGVAGVALATEPGIEAAVTTAVGEAEALTPTGAATLASKRLATDETKISNEVERQELIGAKSAAIDEADRAVDRINSLLTGDRFSSGFGKVVTNTPDVLKSSKAIDTIAELDQIRGLISLESRQKLKGQGTITDSEAKTLEKSATVLSNPLISDDLAKRELNIIKKIFEKSSSRNQLSKETREGLLVKQPEADKGFDLEFDPATGTFK
jgi:hypothetical protein